MTGSRGNDKGKIIYDPVTIKNMKIIIIPNPILTRKSKSIINFNLKLSNFCQNLVKTLLNAKNPPGIGLAAPQVGKNWRIFAITLPDEKPQIFINPKIIYHSKEKKYFKTENRQPFLEGCLSIPKIYGTVKRWPKIKVVWQNEKGEKQQADFNNLKAIVFQHEYDHLEGILFTQRVIEQKGQLYEEKNGIMEKLIEN
ncbi:peptide deformylase [Candidatus Shapirobacteria bacterium CG09_land_8_20_14_0_10_38_17]|uniref:Peptide deformylase n=1 Tax=Candidatus Shapirobacteria bacterium CG09_land_8_20_14_0_10_38_17 TaxID=1974884 RepID=A0A2H0WRR8_9BACT|nr:MAG: peptide deformylase [Candidatus Shapirobacteria bacterium CG09_land_8_20_14_0_10_38_17]